MKMGTNLKHRVRTAVVDSPIPLRVVQDIRMEAHLAGVRARRRLAPNAKNAERGLQELQDIRLHFGCGGRALPGWVNIDGWAGAGTDFVTDLRRPMPFSDESCRFIFTEHVFEHIEEEARPLVLREFWRLLAPGGVARIVVPDCRLFVDAYLREDIEWFANVGYDVESAAAGLNGIFRGHFHRFIDDWESLSTALRVAGFSDVRRCSLNGSVENDLRIDNRELSRSLSSLYVEARR